MQSSDYENVCPECSTRLVDTGDELACPSCGIVREKEVIDAPPPRVPVATDFTHRSLGSFLGSADATMGERFSKGFSKSHSTYRYLKIVSDFLGRDDGQAYECAKLVERVCEKLCLPSTVMAQAVVMARKLLVSPGHGRRVTLAAISAYSILASCRMERVMSVSTREVLEAHSSLGRRIKVSSIIRLSLESGIKIEARKPEEYLSRVLGKLSLNMRLSQALALEEKAVAPYLSKLRQLAADVLSVVSEDMKAGHRPCALAATAVYAADLILAGRESRSRRISQSDVAVCGDTSEYTVREQYRQIFMPSLSNSRFGLEPSRLAPSPR